MSLDQFNIGDVVRIDTIGVDDAAQHRLRALGMIPGTKVRILHKKRSGTVVIDLRGTRFALGAEMTEKIGGTHAGQ